ncbi:MAG: transketolase [Spirochaetia bacterium]|nr:transketolase [Spirochaetia bacterium]
MKVVQKPYAKAFIDFAKDKKDVYCVTADLTSSCEVDTFRDQHPERFISLGMTEQNMVSFCSGLAMEGFWPFIHTFAVFLYRRVLDQIICSAAYPNRKVRLMGFLPGITTPGGITHQAIEDIAVLRCIPNMTILETGDATEVETVLDIADSIDGPVYVRVLRGEVLRLFDSPFQFNRLRLLSEGEDILLLTSGIMTEEALKVTGALKNAGVSICHLHVSTLKPFAEKEFLDCLSKVKHGVITLENHVITGGLGSIVSEIMAENGVSKKLTRLGLKDTFAHGASLYYLLAEYQMDAENLLKTVEKMMNIQTGIKKDNFLNTRDETGIELEKTEDL